MLQLNNTTPFAANMALFPNEHGIDTLYLVTKATFNIGSQWTLADIQAPPLEADEYWGEPNESSLKMPSDMHIGKNATDIILIGNAYAPNEQSVKQLDVTLNVGELTKTVRVFGNRVWQNGQISVPQKFESMPIIYEKAFGGSDTSRDDSPMFDERNPFGVGYAGNRSVEEMNGVALPNLEDPKSLIQSISDAPDPACFAPVASGWKPRQNYAGTYDNNWQTERAPYLPKDFNKKFCNSAHEDLIYSGFLQGGEIVQISNMHPAGSIQCQLPSIKILSKIKLEGKVYQPEFNLETLIIEPNDLTLSMTWRAAFACDKIITRIDEISLHLSR